MNSTLHYSKANDIDMCYWNDYVAPKLNVDLFSPLFVYFR